MQFKNILAVIIILILLFIFYLVLFVIDTKDDNEPVYKYDDIKKNLKTGDIILFSCQYHGSLFNELEYIFRTKLLGSMYGHAGVVIKKNNGEIYIAEVCGHDQCGYQEAYHLNKFNKGGARIINLDTILNFF